MMTMEVNNCDAAGSMHALVGVISQLEFKGHLVIYSLSTHEVSSRSSVA